MSKCFLCENEISQTLFEAENAFVSVADLNFTPYKDTRGGGGVAPMQKAI